MEPVITSDTNSPERGPSGTRYLLAAKRGCGCLGTPWLITGDRKSFPKAKEGREAEEAALCIGDSPKLLPIVRGGEGTTGLPARAPDSWAPRLSVPVARTEPTLAHHRRS